MAPPPVAVRACACPSGCRGKRCQRASRSARQASACGPRRVGLNHEIAQGWIKLWASIRALIGILRHSVVPSLAIRANVVQFSIMSRRGSKRVQGS